MKDEKMKNDLGADAAAVGNDTGPSTTETASCTQWRPLAMKGICECGERFWRHSQAVKDAAQSWHVRTANGRLPVVREIKQPHGEASHYRAVIGSGDTLCGPVVVTLDFGYGHKDDAAVAHLIAAAPKLLAYARLERDIDNFDCPHDAEARCQCGRTIQEMINRAATMREAVIAEAAGGNQASNESSGPLRSEAP